MTNPEQTTDTAHGPASYSVSADGLLSLFWQNITINRVQYRSARVYQYRSRHSDTVHTESIAYREDGREPSYAAVSSIRDELTRLAPVLVTPEATARAGETDARNELARREKASQEAQEAEAIARAALVAACVRVALFEPLKAERLDELEEGAA